MSDVNWETRKIKRSELDQYLEEGWSEFHADGQGRKLEDHTRVHPYAHIKRVAIGG